MIYIQIIILSLFVMVAVTIVHAGIDKIQKLSALKLERKRLSDMNYLQNRKNFIDIGGKQ